MERESRLETQEQLYSKAERCGKDPLLQEMKQRVSSAVGPKRLREHWQPGDTWDMMCQGTAGNQRGSRG